MHAKATCLIALILLLGTAASYGDEKTLDGTSFPRVNLKAPEEHGGLNLFVFSPDGSILAGASGVGTYTSDGETTSFGGEVFLWDPSTGSITRTFGKHNTTPNVLSFSNDGQHLLSYSSKDHVAKLWKVSDGTLVSELKFSGPGSKKQRPIMSPDGTSLVHLTERHLDIGTGDGLDASYMLEAWDIKNKTLLWKKVIDDPNGQLDARFAISPDSKTLALSSWSLVWKQNDTFLSGQNTGKYHALLDLQTGQPIWRIDVHKTDRGRTSEIQVLFTPDGSEILMVSKDAMLRYTTTDGKPIGEPLDLKSKESVAEVFFSQDGKRFLVNRFFDKQIDTHLFPSGDTIFVATFDFPNSFRDGAPSADLKRIAGQLKFDPVVLDLSSGFGQ